MNKDNRLILVDGSAYIFRAYYALPQMSRKDGIPINAVFGFTNMLIKLIEDYKDDPRLEFLGFRMPHTGKNLSLIMKAVDFLPDTHEKVIMVPGGITVQMESDFDWDKIPVIFPEVLENGKILKPDYSKPLSKMNRREKNQVIFDIFKSILTDSKHLEEVIKPLSIQKILILRIIL